MCAQFNSGKKWESKVPNGTYYVRYTTGDPNNTAVKFAQIDVGFVQRNDEKELSRIRDQLQSILQRKK